MQSQIESEFQPTLSQPAVPSLGVQRLVSCQEFFKGLKSPKPHTPQTSQRWLIHQLNVDRRLVIGAIAALSAVVGEGSLLSAQAASLTHWSFDPAVNQLEITVKDGTTPRYFLMAQPARIVVDLPDTAVGNVSTQKTYAGVVRQIRVSQFEPGLTRIVMEISPGVSLAPGQVKLQKVGDRATQASNSRWVLSPLVTKAFSANAVSSPSAAIAPAAPRALDSSPQTPAVISNNLPAPPPLTSPPTTMSTGATTSNVAPDSGSTGATTSNVALANGNNQPTGATVAVPTAPVALAPVLAASPTQRTETATATALPPNAVTPIDPNVAIDTSGGVAIAIPTPPAVLATNVTPQVVVPPAASSPAATPPATSSLATSPPATSSFATSPPTLTAADIPMTMTVAARPSTVAPSVSVPPLNDQVQNDRVQNDRSASQSTPLAPARQPAAASDSLPAFPTLAPTVANSRQPNVSVPPLIRVGTPSLGISTNQPGLASAPLDTSSRTASSLVSVPPLQSVPPQETTAPSAPSLGTTSASYDANTIRQPASTTPLAGTTGAFYDANTVRQPSSSTANLAPPLSLAPLQPPVALIATPTYDANTVRQPPMSLASTPIVAFGQPLPATSEAARVSGQPLAAVNQSPGVRQAFKPTAPNVLLPAGTTLNLLYPGNAALSLRADRPQQEVLVLQTDLRDGAGKLLAPAGSLVTGQFETTTAGSQFVTQAIALTGRSLPLVAQSEALDGTRQVAGNNLALNSGLGVLAGGVLGAIGGSAGLGAIGGAAAGAAATLITAPKPAMIQPGQIVQVRLTQDLSSDP